MKTVTMRETAHALLDRYPDEELPGLIEILSAGEHPTERI